MSIKGKLHECIRPSLYDYPNYWRRRYTKPVLHWHQLVTESSVFLQIIFFALANVAQHCASHKSLKVATCKVKWPGQPAIIGQTFRKFQYLWLFVLDLHWQVGKLLKVWKGENQLQFVLLARVEYLGPRVARLGKYINWMEPYENGLKAVVKW